MENNPSSKIEVAVSSRFLDQQSNRNEGRYVFAYTIRIYNAGNVPARLIARHWQITDANGKVEYVTGEGVIGEQPRLRRRRISLHLWGRVGNRTGPDARTLRHDGR